MYTIIRWCSPRPSTSGFERSWSAPLAPWSESPPVPRRGQRRRERVRRRLDPRMVPRQPGGRRRPKHRKTTSCPPTRRKEPVVSVTAFQNLPLADRDREWDGDEAESRVRKWAGAEDGPNERYRDAHVRY